MTTSHNAELNRAACGIERSEAEWCFSELLCATLLARIEILKEIMASVICAACGWQGRRKTGQIVVCPKCGKCATFK